MPQRCVVRLVWPPLWSSPTRYFVGKSGAMNTPPKKTQEPRVGISTVRGPEHNMYGLYLSEMHRNLGRTDDKDYYNFCGKRSSEDMSG